MVSCPSYPHSVIPYTGKIISSCWISSQKYGLCHLVDNKSTLLAVGQQASTWINVGQITDKLLHLDDGMSPWWPLLGPPFWCPIFKPTYFICGAYLHVSCSDNETEISFWRNFHQWLHWKLSFWQLSVQPVMRISSKLWHFRFSGLHWITGYQYSSHSNGH